MAASAYCIQFFAGEHTLETCRFTIHETNQLLNLEYIMIFLILVRTLWSLMCMTMKTTVSDYLTPTLGLLTSIPLLQNVYSLFSCALSHSKNRSKLKLGSAFRTICRPFPGQHGKQQVISWMEEWRYPRRCRLDNFPEKYRWFRIHQLWQRIWNKFTYGSFCPVR